MWNVEPTVTDRREEMNCKALKKTKKTPQSIMMPLASMQEKSLCAYENKFSKPLPFLCTIASDSNML
jgi:hypothetical protein